MRWVVVAVAALVAVVAANVALLAYGGGRSDPVGKLSPVASFTTTLPSPAPTVTGAHEQPDD